MSTFPTDRRGGYTLMELMVAVSIFLGLLAIVFFFFQFGARAFRSALQKQGVQSDALRVMDSLQADFRRTTAPSVLIRSRQRTVAGVAVGRDAVSFSSLKDWSNPHDSDNFDLITAQPKWNRYWVYYATQNQDRGSLLRVRLDPSPPPVAPLPLTLAEFSAVLQDNPNANLYQGGRPTTSTLCTNVYAFEFRPPDHGEYRLVLKLREKRAPRPGQGRMVEAEDTYEIVTSLRAENTYPQDS